MSRPERDALPPRQVVGDTDTATEHFPARVLQLWHLLSLDAPTVATVWTLFVAHCLHVTMATSMAAAMFLAIWILYAVDRLLDGRQTARPGDLEERHLFHDRHRRTFALAIVAATPFLMALLTRFPVHTLKAYGALGGMLAFWLLVIHLRPRRQTQQPRRLPKELAVGIFFGAAIFVPEFAAPHARWASLTAAAALFAALCTLNCLFIYAWEHAPGETGAAHASTRWAILHLPSLAAALVAAALALAAAEHGSMSTIPLSCILSTAGLVWLNGQAARRTTLRAAADLVLLTPLLFLPFY